MSHSYRESIMKNFLTAIFYLSFLVSCTPEEPKDDMPIVVIETTKPEPKTPDNETKTETSVYASSIELVAKTGAYLNETLTKALSVTKDGVELDKNAYSVHYTWSVNRGEGFAIIGFGESLFIDSKNTDFTELPEIKVKAKVTIATTAEVIEAEDTIQITNRFPGSIPYYRAVSETKEGGFTCEKTDAVLNYSTAGLDTYMPAKLTCYLGEKFPITDEDNQSVSMSFSGCDSIGGFESTATLIKQGARFLDLPGRSFTQVELKQKTKSNSQIDSLNIRNNNTCRLSVSFKDPSGGSLEIADAIEIKAVVNANPTITNPVITAPMEVFTGSSLSVVPPTVASRADRTLTTTYNWVYSVKNPNDPTFSEADVLSIGSDASSITVNSNQAHSFIAVVATVTDDLGVSLSSRSDFVEVKDSLPIGSQLRCGGSVEESVHFVYAIGAPNLNFECLGTIETDLDGDETRIDLETTCPITEVGSGSYTLNIGGGFRGSGCSGLVRLYSVTPSGEILLGSVEISFSEAENVDPTTNATLSVSKSGGGSFKLGDTVTASLNGEVYDFENEALTYEYTFFVRKDGETERTELYKGSSNSYVLSTTDQRLKNHPHIEVELEVSDPRGGSVVVSGSGRVQNTAPSAVSEFRCAGSVGPVGGEGRILHNYNDVISGSMVAAMRPTVCVVEGFYDVDSTIEQLDSATSWQIKMENSTCGDLDFTEEKSSNGGLNNWATPVLQQSRFTMTKPRINVFLYIPRGQCTFTFVLSDGFEEVSRLNMIIQDDT